MKPRPLEDAPSLDRPGDPAPAPLRDRIVELFSEKLNIEVASAETDLMETGALDSLALVELLFHLEQELGIKIALESLDLENFRSVARIADFIAAGAGTNGNGSNRSA